jgi:predicted DNA-binding transcriptional regulator AlpA
VNAVTNPNKSVIPHDGTAQISGGLYAPLWSRACVLKAYGDKSVSWLYEEMAADRVPRPIRIGRNSVAWVAEQVLADIEAKIAAGPVELTAKPRTYKSKAGATEKESRAA